MAIAQMVKIVIISHRSQASELLEALQDEGICQILNAQESVVSRDFPELAGMLEKPKDIERTLNRLDKGITFLKNYAEQPKGLAAALAPRTVIDRQLYNQAISNQKILEVVEQCEQIDSSMEKTKGEIQNLQNALETLRPWEALDTPVEEIGLLSLAKCWSGLVPVQHFVQARDKLTELGAVIQQVGSTGSKYSCLIISLIDKADEVQKVLRSEEFEAVSFEGLSGTVSDLIEERSARLAHAKGQLEKLKAEAKKLSKQLLQLQILYDHYKNLLNRETAKETAPATEQTVILEGWVKKHDYKRLEDVISRFDAASLSRTEPAEGEEPPVEIENKKAIKPFEVVTRLYGMPQHFDVDPTAFLAPFFALFFALCLTDAGYGLVMIVAIALFIKKIQGDKKLMWMLGICSVLTVLAGALTGGWFGDAIQQLNINWLNTARNSMLWFDPLDKPMNFFYISLVLGYIQIMVGLIIAFGHNLRRKAFVAAVCDQLTWIIMLNSIVLFGASKAGAIPPRIGSFFGYLAIVPAIMIFLFSHREGGVGGRIGMGAYNLFSAIFYMGDVLSYLRLMALGMVTAGLAMAINVIAGIAVEIPYGIGFALMIIVLVGGHGFNLAISALSAFVHTLRLQYVEFFPKFLTGGGRLFEPLSKRYEHIYIGKVSG